MRSPFLSYAEGVRQFQPRVTPWENQALVPTLKGLTRILLVVSIGSPFQGDKSFSGRFPQGVTLGWN